MTQELKSQLRAAHHGLVEAMRAAVQAELSNTVQRWQNAGSPEEDVWLRNAPGSQENLEVLTAWTWLGADLVYSGQPWEAAAAEKLYALAVELAHQTDNQHPGLRLHKGIDYFMLGMAQFLQGRYDEGSHNILIAVEEDRDAKLKDNDIVAASELQDRVLPRVLTWLGPFGQACRNWGHGFVTPSHIGGMAEQMTVDAAGGFSPEWLLWLFQCLAKTNDLPGSSPLTPVRRLEALQDLTFLYEAALKQHLCLPGGTLKAVVREVQAQRAHVPQAVVDRWEEFTRFGLQDSAYSDPDKALTALMSETFGGASAPEVECCRAIAHPPSCTNNSKQVCIGCS